jgi:hypothetical protein
MYYVDLFLNASAALRKNKHCWLQYMHPNFVNSISPAILLVSQDALFTQGNENLNDEEFE